MTAAYGAMARNTTGRHPLALIHGKQLMVGKFFGRQRNVWSGRALQEIGETGRT
jgi:hypothetical protein